MRLKGQASKVAGSVALLPLFVVSVLVGGFAPSVKAVENCGLLPSSFQSNPDVRLAIVMPLLTTAAYVSPYSRFSGVPPAFYDFYARYEYTPIGTIITGDTTDWLKVDVGSNFTGMGALLFNGGWGSSFSLYQFLMSSAAKRCGITNVQVITDLAVAGGSLFTNGTRNYDVLVIGHDEYVTLDELTQYQHFVSSGGRIILMDGDNFEVQVGFDYWYECADSVCWNEPHETFIQGHGWTYNGQYANHSGIWNQFPVIDTKLTAELLPATYGGEVCWNATIQQSDVIGSALYALYGSVVFKNQLLHEPSRLVNQTDTTPIINCNGPYHGIEAYIHKYGLGTVVSYLGIGSATIGNSNVTQSFLLLSILSAPVTTTVPHTACPTTLPLIEPSGGSFQTVGQATLVPASHAAKIWNVSTFSNLGATYYLGNYTDGGNVILPGSGGPAKSHYALLDGYKYYPDGRCLSSP